MPSWNIHIAHAEGLLQDAALAGGLRGVSSGGRGAFSQIVRDRNAFLFGNLVPDIYVGYMVPGVVRPIPYRVTHFAAPEHIPKPREREFWDTYVAPLARELRIGCADDGMRAAAAPPARTGACGSDAPRSSEALGGAVPHAGEAPGANALYIAGGASAGIEAGSLAREVAHVSPAHTPTYELAFDPAQSASFQQDAFEAARTSTAPFDGRRSLFDLVLGAWVHLLADTIWNHRVSEYLDALGEKPSKDFRIKKQGDFDQFGKSLSLDAFPTPTLRLIDAAGQFPQYAIDEHSVCAACAIAHEIVRTNSLVGQPSYRLLTEEFFVDTFAEVQRLAARFFKDRL